MSLPPLNLLLPHIYTFKDQFDEYPLLITSISPSLLISFILLYHATETPVQKSILIHYGELGDALSHKTSTFLKSDASRKGKFLQAGTGVQIMQVKTLHELRALLFLLTTCKEASIEGTSDVDERHKDVATGVNETTSVADSEESLIDDTGLALPLLAISGIDRVHRDAGELSAQGLSRTLASAMEACGDQYKLVLYGDEDLDDDLALMNDSSYLPDQLASATTTFRKVYKRYVACEWNDMFRSRDGRTEGLWRYLDGGGYKVQWQQDDDGQCSNSSVARL